MRLHTSQQWVVVMPVKEGTAAKSRLSGLAAVHRTDLALAFALDAAAAARRSGGVVAVLAVTDDTVAAARLRQLGCSTVADDPRNGLNPAVQHGVDVARQRWPGCWVAVLPGDLPALRPDDLAAALAAAALHPRAFVPDAAGWGTNLLTVAPGVPVDARFEGASCAAHAATGAVRLNLPSTGLRHDVDDHADLRRAQVLGLGPETTQALSRIDASSGHYDDGMQATVAFFDDETRSGSVLADDGVELPFTAAALDGTRLRFLRRGQRVRISVGAGGGVDAIQILTLPA